MLINLLGPIILHPYVDQDEISFLTKDTRPKGAVASVHDGLVYEQQGSSKQVLVATHWQVQEGMIRTAIPLLSARGRKFTCGHSWWDHTFESLRIITVRLESGVLIVAPMGGQPLVVDLGLEMELTQVKRTLWDLLVED